MKENVKDLNYLTRFIRIVLHGRWAVSICTSCEVAFSLINFDNFLSAHFFVPSISSLSSAPLRAGVSFSEAFFFFSRLFEKKKEFHIFFLFSSVKRTLVLLGLCHRDVLLVLGRALTLRLLAVQNQRNDLCCLFRSRLQHRHLRLFCVCLRLCYLQQTIIEGTCSLILVCFLLKKMKF